MHDFTVIVMPDEPSRVRRFRVSRRWLVRVPYIAAALGLVALLGLADYVRLRLERVDVAALREESSNHEREIAALEKVVGSLETDLSRLREFERKVRIIADLPGALPEVALPPASPSGGQGGDEPDAARADALGVPAVPSTLLDASLLFSVDARVSRLESAFGQRSASLVDLLAGLEGKSDQLAATPSIAPTAGWVTSGFGWRTSPFTGRRQRHNALDIAAAFGTPILAPARGRVVFAGRKGPLGNAVVIDHGHGLRSTYGHAAELLVDRGQTVDRGVRIATVGSTGRSTGPHLHYLIERNGEPVDPASYILD